eukprot:3013696-Alexandrium_andersonii.AAC.1
MYAGPFPRPAASGGPLKRGSQQPPGAHVRQPLRPRTMSDDAERIPHDSRPPICSRGTAEEAQGQGGPCRLCLKGPRARREGAHLPRNFMQLRL